LSILACCGSFDSFATWNYQNGDILNATEAPIKQDHRL
jgi:hypothetical protein